MSLVRFARPRAGKKKTALQTGRVYLWVPRPLIVDINYLTEAYEGLLVPSTLDPGMGLVRIIVAPGGEEEAREVIGAILEEYPGIKPAGPRNRAPEPA